MSKKKPFKLPPIFSTKSSSRSPAHASDNRIFQRTGLYLMTNFPYILKNKFGISDHEKRRRANVSETTPGIVGTILCLKLTYGHQKEGFVHALYFWANMPFSKGSGRSEWYANVSPLCWFLFTWYMPEAPMMAKGIVLITPVVWLDGLFWLLFFGAMDFVFWAMLICGIMYAIVHF